MNIHLHSCFNIVPSMKPLLEYMLQDLENFQEFLFPGLKRLRSKTHENQVGLVKLEGGE